MSTLARLQRGFCDYLLAGDPSGIRPLVDPERDPARRLGIYAAAYRLRLKEALATDFTLLAARLGSDRFAALSDAYIDRYPSDHYNIRHYGRHMERFLADAPLLAELEAFEWAQGLSFDAPDAAPVGPEAVAAVPPRRWGGLRLRFHPSVQRRDLAWNVHALWSALQAGEPLPPARREPALRPWLFWRQAGRNAYVSLEPGQAAALDAARAGSDFAGLCEALCAWHQPEAVPGEAAAELKGWLEAGLVVAVQADA